MALIAQSHVGTLLDLTSPRATPHESALGHAVDRQLLESLDTLQVCYSAGCRNFLIVTHRRPDPDAVGASLGVGHLITDWFGSGVTVRYLHDGEVRPEYCAATGYKSEPIEELLKIASNPAAASKCAIILVDQPSLHWPTVLPDRLMNDPRLRSLYVAVIYDHHEGTGSAITRVVVPSAGSTSALIVRTLDLYEEAKRQSSPRSVLTPWTDRKDLVAALEAGVLTDAAKQLCLTTDPFHGDDTSAAAQASRRLQPCVDLSALSMFDLSCVSDRLLSEARSMISSADLRRIGGVQFGLLTTFAGVCESTDFIGDCASKLANELGVHESGGGQTVLALAGVVRNRLNGHRGPILPTDRVHIAVRGPSGTLVPEICRKISPDGGGRSNGAGSANMAVHRSCWGYSVRRYANTLEQMISNRIPRVG